MRRQQISLPLGIVVDEAGTLFVADSGNGRIRQITPDGQVSTIAEANGERVRLIAPDGTVSTLAGSGEIGFRDWL